MSDLPEPPVPADVDLRDFAFMPLDVRRLFTSETWLLGTAEEKVAALALWCESWHQVPAASLPDNERMLAHLSQAGPRWSKVREHVLRSWTKCSDGRLYHRVVAEKALESWEKKVIQRRRSKIANEARWGKKEATVVEGDRDGRLLGRGVEEGEESSTTKRGDANGDGQGLHAALPQGIPQASLNDPKGQGEGEKKEPPVAPQGAKEAGKGNGKEPHPHPPSQPKADFARFRAAYPKRSGPQDWKTAEERFARAVKAGVRPDAIMAGLAGYVAELQSTGKVGTEFVKQAAVFLSRETWREYGDSGAPSAPTEVTEETWTNRLEAARLKGKWSVERWGPMPGQPGCEVPAHLLRPVDGEGWQPWEAR